MEAEATLSMQLMTQEEVAQVLNVKPGTVYGLHRVGRLRGVLIGKELRWTRAAVQTFIRTLEAAKERPQARSRQA